jgi:uridine kinase
MNRSKPYLVGIAGGSASGKTHLLNSLLSHYTSDQVCLLSQDDYYKPIQFQYIDENGEINYDLPEGIDREQLLQDVQILQSGKSFEKMEYTFNNPNATPKLLTINSAPIIIIEGLFILYFKELANLFDLKVFIDADDEIKLQRRLKRDQEERGYSEQTILYQWHNHVIPAYQKYLLPYKEMCDVVIHNNESMDKEIESLCKRLKDWLR